MAILKLIFLFLVGIAFIYAWWANKRAAKRHLQQKLSFREYMLQHGIKSSIPVSKLEIITTTDRDEFYPTNKYEGLSAQLYQEAPKYDYTHTTRLGYKTTINGEEVSIFSQPYPVDKQYMLFAMMGKDSIDVYTLHDSDTIYFDLEVGQ